MSTSSLSCNNNKSSDITTRETICLIEQIRNAENLSEKQCQQLIQRVSSLLSDFIKFQLFEHRLSIMNEDVSLVTILDNHPKILKLISFILQSSNAIPFPKSVLFDCIKILLSMFALASKNTSTSGSISENPLYSDLRVNVIQFCLRELQSLDVLPLLVNKSTAHTANGPMAVNFCHPIQFTNKDDASDLFANSCTDVISHYPNSICDENRRLIVSLLHLYLTQTNFSVIPPKLMQDLQKFHADGSLRLFDTVLSLSDRASFCCAHYEFCKEENRNLILSVISQPLLHLIDEKNDCFIGNELSNSRIEMLSECFVQDSSIWRIISNEYQNLYKETRNEHLLRLYKLLLRKVVKQCNSRCEANLDQFCNMVTIVKELLSLCPQHKISSGSIKHILGTIETPTNEKQREEMWFFLQSLPWLETSCIKALMEGTNSQLQTPQASYDQKNMNNDYKDLMRLICYINLAVWDDAFKKYAQDRQQMDGFISCFSHLTEAFALFKKQRKKDLATFTNKLISFLYNTSMNVELLPPILIFRYMLLCICLNDISLLNDYCVVIQQFNPRSIKYTAYAYNESIELTFRAQLCQIALHDMQYYLYEMETNKEAHKQILLASCKLLYHLKQNTSSQDSLKPLNHYISYYKFFHELEELDLSFSRKLNEEMRAV